ncbi:50S ribosomal protein L4 [Spiroplasma endosymbiont of Labia minor]|uniref:50S ribosomal protein L4 n=1 Tax=Spiroplasma endosymbiont of Labia minor TaxID=3066305 RepID=UPI0030D2C863
MKYKVLDMQGSEIKNIELNDSVWSIKPHTQAIYDTVIAQQAALRQGTKKVKTRAEVSGGGRKPWKQKGTGRARQGSIRSPQWRGGGIAFGPTPNINYKKSVNKKVRILAFKSVLSEKIKELNLIIIDGFNFETPSTKAMLKSLTDLKIDNQKTLIVTKTPEESLEKSGRNIQEIKIIDVQKLNIFDIMNATKLIITEEVVKRVEEVYA